jgi:hypothetical protein
MPNISLVPIELIEHEFAQERASALGRLGRALETALRLLQEFDSEHAGQPLSVEMRRVRLQLIDDASVALWYFVVQREACGLSNVGYALRDYRVPAEVSARAGMSYQLSGISRQKKRGPRF